MEEKEINLKKLIKSDKSFSEKVRLNIAIKESKKVYIEKINMQERTWINWMVKVKILLKIILKN